MSAHRGKSGHPADGLTLPVLTTESETPNGNRWFRDEEQSVFATYVRNRTHRHRLSKRSTEPDFNRHPEKTDRY
jgi:hypothetical protein